MSNSWFPESQDRQPLTWWKQKPVYLAAILALGGAASMVMFAIFGGPFMNHLVFSVDGAFVHGKLWTLVTYILVNPPSLWILFGCYLIWRFGESIERHLGRRAFVRLLLLLLIVSPVFILLLHGFGMPGRMCAGMMELEFGVFIAFATLYPRAEISLILFSLEAWILATILVTVGALQSIASRDIASLVLLTANVGTAFLFVRHETGVLKIPAILTPTPKAKSKLKPKKTSKSPSSSIDEILDKISRDGIDSLTEKEKRTLSEESDKMKRRSDEKS